MLAQTCFVPGMSSETFFYYICSGYIPESCERPQITNGIHKNANGSALLHCTAIPVPVRTYCMYIVMSNNMSFVQLI